MKMKIWKKVRFLEKDKKIDGIIRSYVNYIYKDSPINDLAKKYRIDPSDIIKLNQYTADRLAGLLLLAMAKDKERLQDIVLKYQSDQLLVGEIIPELEGYIEK